MDTFILNSKTGMYKQSLIVKNHVIREHDSFCRTMSYFVSYFLGKWNIVGFIDYFYSYDGDDISSELNFFPDYGSVWNEKLILRNKSILLLSKEMCFKRI